MDCQPDARVAQHQRSRLTRKPRSRFTTPRRGIETRPIQPWKETIVNKLAKLERLRKGRASPQQVSLFDHAERIRVRTLPLKLSPLSVEEAIKWQSIAALHRAEGNMTEAGAMEARAAEALDVALTPLDP
jgi:hypothetical protein